MNIRTELVVVIAVVLLSALSATAEPDATAVSHAHPPAGLVMKDAKRFAAVDETWAKLDQKVTFDSPNNQLSKALDQIAAQTGVQIAVNFEKLRETVGVNGSTNVALRIEDVPAHLALRNITEAVTTSTGHTLLFDVDSAGIVQVGGATVLRDYRYVMVYDLRPIIQSTMLHSVLTVGYTGDGFICGTGMTEPYKPTAEDLRVAHEELHGQIVEMLMNLIRDTVGKQQEWTLYGGDISSVREIGGLFIVHAPSSRHRDLKQLLNQLHSPDVTFEPTDDKADAAVE